MFCIGIKMLPEILQFIKKNAAFYCTAQILLL